MEASFDQKINVVYLDESRRTPVHRAALDGKHEQVEEKVRVASGLDDQDKQERTPLHHATEHGCHSWRSQTQFSSPLILISENNTYCKIYKLQWMRSY